MSRKPPVDVHDFEPFYAYLDEKQPSARLGLTAFAILNWLYAPKVHVQDEVREKTIDYLDRGYRLGLVSEHATRQKPCEDGGMAHQLDFLAPVRNNITIMAFSKMFGNPPMRWFVENVGGVAAWREKDDDSLEAEARKAANDRMVQTMIKRVNGGMHALIYPEGQTNKVDPRKVQPLQRGIGRLVCGIDSDVDIALLPIGPAYRPPAFYRRLPSALRIERGAHMVLGMPFEPTRQSPEAVIEQVAPAMQAQVDLAYEFLQAAA